jgi:hypothetical protein
VHVRLGHLAAAIVGALAVAAVASATASATLTTTLARGGSTSGGRDAAFTRAGLGARCPTSTFVSTVAPDGLSTSGELDFSNGGRPTCSGTFGVSCEVTTRGRTPTRITIRSTASTAGVSASFDLVLDSDFTLEIRCMNGGLVCTISGPQIIGNAGAYQQGRPSRRVMNARGISCAEGGTVDHTGSYSIAQTFTIS